MTAFASDALEKGSAARLRSKQPGRSRVGPVTHQRGDDSSETVKKLLAGLEPRVASEALARAEILANLPAAQQMALRCALAAASESFKEADSVQSDLAKVKEQQRRTDKERVAESQIFRLQSERAEAQVADLRENLAAAIAVNETHESLVRRRMGHLWLTFFATIAALAVCFILLPREKIPPALDGLSTVAPAASNAEVILRRSREEIVLQSAPEETPPMQGKDGASVVETAFNRLDGALGGVPLTEVDRVLRQANQWLLASGIPPCTIELPEGQTSLLVGTTGKRAGSLTRALLRCAEAVDHVRQ